MQPALALLTLGTLLAAPLSCVKAKPPFDGTLFVSPDIITNADPTAFQRLKPAGTGTRKMYDRRSEGWIQVEAHLFTAAFRDSRNIEVQVNPEFTALEALAQAQKYLPDIGRIPAALRAKVETVWIHNGNHGFGGGNNNLLIHTEMGASYIEQGLLAEAFLHEATHTSLDPLHLETEGWQAARRQDGRFISVYAKQYPGREDLAETVPLYFALRFRPERLPKETREKIEQTIPHRLTYLDQLKLQPVRE